MLILEVRNLKKILLVILGVLIVSFSLLFTVYSKYNNKQEEPKILTELNDNGNVNGKREFVFSITNVGASETTLEFPTWLEYNYSIEILNNTKISDDIIVEHVDLNENDKDSDGRTLVLAPNQKVDYKLLVSNIPKGNYEITISPALDYGAVRNHTFEVVD